MTSPDELGAPHLDGRLAVLEDPDGRSAALRRAVVAGGSGTLAQDVLHGRWEGCAER